MVQQSTREAARTQGHVNPLGVHCGQVLAKRLDRFGVPEGEKGEVLGAFAAHKAEVIAGSQGALARDTSAPFIVVRP
ncbi:MAG: hypothetical protein M1274_06470 [Actinobacteria bacterium]|nr:hypothetical protein [Actinomycetota bacterium]